MDDSDVFEGMYGHIDAKGWGPWQLDRHSRTVFVREPFEYWIPIDDVSTPEGIAHWLMHIAEKTWVTNECLGGLVRVCLALRDAPADPIWTERKDDSAEAKENKADKETTP